MNKLSQYKHHQKHSSEYNNQLKIPKNYTEVSDESLAFEIPHKSKIEKGSKMYHNKTMSQAG